MDKAKELHGLMKLPSEALITELKIEIGKRDAYITELEEGNASLKSEMKLLEQSAKGSAGELRAIRKDAVCMEYKAEMKRMRNTICTLRRDKDSLIVKLNRRV